MEVEKKLLSQGKAEHLHWASPNIFSPKKKKIIKKSFRKEKKIQLPKRKRNKTKKNPERVILPSENRC